MERTQVFVSYSSQDSEWRDRLLLHLAPLDTRATIHVWSDTQIDAGANWKEEIEKALRKAGAAVLLVTPAFLASEFIWTEEMPRILKHRESGMLVFPLIVKACAWQLESALERIQARPKGVRPLALASEAEVDRDLAEFIRELAAAVSSVTERTETLPQVTGATELKDQAGQRVKGIWQGTYDSTNRKLRLVVDEESGSTFSGRMEYVNENVCTRVSGKIRSDTP